VVWETLAVHIGKIMGWKVREPPKPEEWELPYFRRMFADYNQKDRKLQGNP